MKTKNAIKKILQGKTVTVMTTRMEAEVTVQGDGSDCPKVYFGSEGFTDSQWLCPEDLRELSKFFKKLADALDGGEVEVDLSA